MPEYSVWNPPSVRLALGMSKGVRLISAMEAIRKMTKAISPTPWARQIHQPSAWLCTIADKLHRTREHHHCQQRQRGGNFVGNYLRTGTHRADQRPLVVGAPAARECRGRRTRSPPSRNSTPILMSATCRIGADRHHREHHTVPAATGTAPACAWPCRPFPG